MPQLVRRRCTSAGEVVGVLDLGLRIIEERCGLERRFHLNFVIFRVGYSVVTRVTADVGEYQNGRRRDAADVTPCAPQEQIREFDRVLSSLHAKPRTPGWISDILQSPEPSVWHPSFSSKIVISGMDEIEMDVRLARTRSKG